MYIDRLFEVYRILAKKYREVISHDPEDWCKICLKNTRIWWNLTRAHEILQNLHFHLLLLCKVFNFWPKKVHKNYLSLHWRVMQNFKKNWLLVWKTTWGIWQIFTWALKSLKIGKMGLWWDSLIQSRKSMSLKFTEELCVMALKDDEKF